MFLLASITLLILRSTTVLSQSNVDFIQTLLNGQPANVVVTSDPIDRFTTQFYPFNDYFTISYNTIVQAMQIRMIKGIDRDGTTSSTEDDVNILQYQLVCYPDVSSVASNSAIFKVLKIQIVDVNDNAPIFVNAPYSLSVNELTPVGITVFRGISATDLDEGPNKQIFYSLSVGTSQFNFNGTAYFNLPSEQDGILAVLNAIDFESMYRVTRDASLTYFNLTITARDNASPPSAQKSTQTSIKILITDSDDQGPEFVYPSCIQNKLSNSNSCVRAKYSASITSGNVSLIYPLDLMPEPRDVTNSTAKVTILMQDRDNLNSSLICRIIRTEPPGYESYFGTTSALYRSNTKQYRCDIEKSGGRIVYRSNTSSIELIIEAQEQSPNARTEYASVLVSVLPSNLIPPVITYNSNTGYIFENSSVGARVYTDAAASTTLLKLAFTDPEASSSDPPVQFTTTVSAGQPFAVTQEGYIVLNSSVLDYEATTKYVLTVTVTKATSPWYSATVTVTVNVLNVNDNSPVILVPDNYSVTVTAGNYTTAAPRVIVTVQATDIDFGPPQFKLNRVVPANATSKFLVSQNGSLSVTGSLSPGDLFAVYVTASDLGKPVRSTEAFVVVSVPISCRKSPRKYLVYINEEETINATVYVPIEGQPLPLP